MKITKATIEMDLDTFAPMIVFEGQIELEPIQDNQEAINEEEYTAQFGADAVKQIKEHLKNRDEL